MIITRILSSVTTHLPVWALGVGQRLAGQPEVALLESEAGQQLGPLGLVLVEEALLHRDRGQEHGPVRHLPACRGSPTMQQCNNKV